MSLAHLAWLAPLLMAWRQIHSVALQGARFLIRKDTFDISLWGDVELALRRRYRILPGARLWSRVRLPGKREGAEVVLVADSSQDTLWLVGLYGVPFVAHRHSTTITYLWGTVDLRPVWNRLGEARARLAESRREVADKDIGCGFRIQRVFPMHGVADSKRTASKDLIKAAEPMEVAADPEAASAQTPGMNMLLQASRDDEWADLLPLAYDERQAPHYKSHNDEPSYAEFGYDACGYVHTEVTLGVVDDVRRWARDRQWFSERGIPWRRGVALVGQPGTGKSLLALAMARRFNMPLYVMDLAMMSNDDLANARQSLRVTPAFLLIEDVDAVFHGRVNVADVGDLQPKLTFDALLQFFGGVEQLNGIYVVATSNHREHLDPALTRPGRIDNVVEIQPMGKDPARMIAANVLRDWPEEVDRVLESTDFPIPASSFVETCVKVAYKRWSQADAVPAVEARPGA